MMWVMMSCQGRQEVVGGNDVGNDVSSNDVGGNDGGGNDVGNDVL